MVEQLGGRLHVVAVVMPCVVGGAVEHTHNVLGVLAVHPGAVAPQVLVLVEVGGMKENEQVKLSGCDDT